MPWNLLVARLKLCRLFFLSWHNYFMRIGMSHSDLVVYVDQINCLMLTGMFHNDLNVLQWNPRFAQTGIWLQWPPHFTRTGMAYHGIMSHDGLHVHPDENDLPCPQCLTLTLMSHGNIHVSQWPQCLTKTSLFHTDWIMKCLSMTSVFHGDRHVSHWIECFPVASVCRDDLPVSHWEECMTHDDLNVSQWLSFFSLTWMSHDDFHASHWQGCLTMTMFFTIRNVSRWWLSMTFMFFTDRDVSRWPSCFSLTGDPRD